MSIFASDLRLLGGTDPSKMMATRGNLMLVKKVMQDSGNSFLDSLTGADIQRLRAAQLLLVSALGLPLALYHAGTSEARPLFPNTISWSIRKGLPKHASHALWTIAWLLMLSVFRRRGDFNTRMFALQMCAKGVITVLLCPASSEGIRWKIHKYGATSYLLDHQTFAWLLDIRPIFMLGFWACFLCSEVGSAISSHLLRSVQPEARKQDIPPLLRSGTSSPQIRNGLWYAELMQMLTENGMFMVFVSGMLSGVPRKLSAARE